MTASPMGGDFRGLSVLDIHDNLTASVFVFCPGNYTDRSYRSVVSDARDIVASGLGVEVFLAQYNFAPYAQEEIEKLREIAQKARVLTCHTNQSGWDQDKLEAEIRLVAALGGSILVVHTATLGLERCDNPPQPRVLRDICKFAMDSGIRIALENSGRTGIAMIHHALDTIGADAASIGMGICIDTGHANRSVPLDGVHVQDYLCEFRDIIIEVHVNDNLGGEDLHLIPGQGNIAWDAVMPELRALPETTVVCIELARPDNDPMEALRQSCEFLCGNPLSSSRN